MIENAYIGFITGAWAFLWAGPLSEPEEIFAGVKRLACRTCPWWLYKPLIGCAKCSAFWWSAVVLARIGEVRFEIIITAVLTAYALQRKYE